MDGAFRQGKGLLQRWPDVHTDPASTEYPRKDRAHLILLNVFILARVPINGLMAKNSEATTINAEMWFHQVGCIHIPQSQGKSHETEPMI
jgi:hypothetical protein